MASKAPKFPKALSQIERELEDAANNYHPAQRMWTSEEEGLIRKYYGRVPIQILSEKLNRTIESVQSHAGHRGLQRKRGK